MQIGVTFPQTEIGPDPAAIRAYAEATQDLGYQHLLVYDHVVGADLRNRPDWNGPYNVDTQFHEPFVLFGYLAAVAPKLELVTGIVILPQRQTVLVAKQAAEVDLLTEGKFRLGVGVGWNDVEFQALGESFGNRGRRSEEQIELLRRLFTEPSVTFNGKWHTVDAAGINPLPVQRPIPIWIGGSSDATYRRIARIGDGWFPQISLEHAPQAMDTLHEALREAGRDASAVGIEPRLTMSRTPRKEWESFIQGWQDLGATHMSVNTMGLGLQSVDEHIQALREFSELVAVGPARADGVR